MRHTTMRCEHEVKVLVPVVQRWFYCARRYTTMRCVPIHEVKVLAVQGGFHCAMPHTTMRCEHEVKVSNVQVVLIPQASHHHAL